MTPARARYTTVAIVLHWLIAAAIVFQIILGWQVADAPKGPAGFALFQLHKSIGFTILFLSLARLAWRLGHRPPPPPLGQPRWEQIAAQIVHFGFYVIMIGLPLTGWIMVSAASINIPTLLFGTVPWPHLPLIADLAAGPKHVWEAGGRAGHGLLVKATYVLLALHLGAVARHQLLDRDEVFSHMAPGAAPGWREPRAWLVIVVLAAVGCAAFFYLPAAKAPAAIASTTTPQPESSNADSSDVVQAAQTGTPVAWKVQQGSTLGFTATWAGDAIVGHFGRWTAQIQFSDAALDTSSLVVTVDLASATTGDEQRDSSLVGEDFFNVKVTPRATYTATSFRKIGDGRYLAVGTLDLCGIKKSLDLPFTLTIENNVATVKGAATVDRTDFGVGRGEWAATDQIAGAVVIDFSVIANSDSGQTGQAAP